MRHALRSLAKTPGFTLIAIVTLALGVGLNTSIFSLINVILLRPLPFENSESLVRLHRATPQNPTGDFSPADYLDLHRAESSPVQIAAYDNASVSLSEPGRAAEQREALRVSANFFDVLKITPQLGRVFRPEEEIFGEHRVALLSHAIWQTRFAGAADIVGRTLRIQGETHEIVGVLPAWADDGRLIRHVDLFRPLSFTAAETTSRDHQWLDLIGRRGDGVSAAQADAFIASFGARLAREHPRENAEAAWRTEDLLLSTSTGIARVIVSMLLGLSGFVLLIACSNLANFLLARTIARSHEFGVRASLGATRLQLLRPIAYESLLLTIGGGAGALLIARWGTDWLSAQSVATGNAPIDFPLDWRVLGFALGTALFTALFFGIAPALFALRIDVNQTLKGSGARGATASRGHRRLRHLLIVGQFAMAMILLSGAGFLLRGADNLLRQHFGWDSDRVVQGGFELPQSKYAGGQQILAFHRQVLERLEQLPGIESASLSYGLPSTGLIGPRAYVVAGREPPAQGLEPAAACNGVTPAYFDVTGIRILRGRTFGTADTADSPRVVIVSESMARALFPHGNPLGQRIAQAGDESPEWAEIVGVAADVRSIAIYQRPVAFQVYHPFSQEPWHYSTFAVRTDGLAAESVIASVRTALTALDPDLPVRNVMKADAMIERSAFDLTMLRNMLGAFALLGLSLAGLGLYGVIARSVVQRTAEIGIRMALGARVADILRLVLGSGLRLALVGATLGLFGAFGLSRLIASVMPSMQADGNLVLLFAPGVLIVVALVASYLPARTASKVDPVTALRTG